MVDPNLDYLWSAGLQPGSSLSPELGLYQTHSAPVGYNRPLPKVYQDPVFELGQLWLPVRDLIRSYTFYAHDVGLIPKEYSPEKGQAVFDVSGIDMVLEEWPVNDPIHQSVSRFSLVVTGLDALYEQLIFRGVTNISVPTVHQDDSRQCTVVDPDGHVMRFIERNRV